MKICFWTKDGEMLLDRAQVTAALVNRCHLIVHLKSGHTLDLELGSVAIARKIFLKLSTDAEDIDSSVPPESG